MTHKLVEIPTARNTRGARNDELAEAIISAAKQGLALAFEIPEGRTADSLRCTLDHAMRLRGLKIHTSKRGYELYVWVDPASVVTETVGA